MVDVLTLAQLGERKLIDRLQHRYESGIHHIGDDCAVVLENAGTYVLATTDPAPRPVCWEFGFRDLYYWGWLLAAINLSDINAAGASAAGFLSSLTLPSNLPVKDFDRLLAGIDDACALAGTRVIGGNLKEDPSGRISCEGTAFGTTTGTPLGRRGARAGDVIVAVGNTGYFWSALQLLIRGMPCDDVLLDHFLKPKPLHPIGQNIREAAQSRVAADASDGLYAAVASLTTQNGLGAELTIDDWELPEIVQRTADRLQIDRWRLAMGFGDLQFVTAVHPSNFAAATDSAKSLGLETVLLGTVTETGSIYASYRGRHSAMNNFDNERFVASSQFTQGIHSFNDSVLSRSLWLDSSY